MKKIILSADSICDLNEELTKKYDIHYYPYTILLEDKAYKDNVDITPEDIYKVYREKKILPKTSAINVSEYYNYFKPWVDEGYEVIHITLGSALTSSYNNCCLAASELKSVYPVDSCSLSSGTGLLVLKAGELIKEGLPAEEIVNILNEHKRKIHASFILDTLDFMHAGGRCSKVASIASSMLKIKPSIEVDNTAGGKMDVGNKYRGSLEKVLIKYIQDKLNSYDNINNEKIFITHAGIDDKYIEIAKKTILDIMEFKEIYVTVASCTISSHCGPNTIGILFETR